MSYELYKAKITHCVAEYLDVPYEDAWDVVSCLRKSSWDTEEEAAEHGAKWGNVPYQCPVCHRWHLTKGDR